jgi:hypothetical protein
MRRRFAFVVLACLLAAPVAALAQPPDAPKASPWDALRFLEGTWTGESEGEPGKGTVERTFAFTLGDRFLEVRNASLYAPQERNPKGERHEDRGLVSFDRARRRFVLRQFHVEGFVNQYVADSLGSAPDSIVFTSEAIENIPPGFRARETWRFVSPTELHEHFELAEPGKGFETYSRARLVRRR